MAVDSAGEATTAGRSGASADNNDYRKNTTVMIIYIYVLVGIFRICGHLCRTTSGIIFVKREYEWLWVRPGRQRRRGEAAHRQTAVTIGRILL
jgi:hypothetical protein